ncbi:MAG: phosphatidylserine decarboxylase [Rhodothermales bacterium]
MSTICTFPKPTSISLHAKLDTEPVKKLKALYASDADFRQNVAQAFSNLVNKPTGESNPWQGKGIEDLYTFFNEWYYFLPKAEDSLDRIKEFAMLYYRNPYGLKLVKEEPGLSWTKFFVEERGRYMDSALSKSTIDQWLNEPSLPHDDFVIPEDGFKSFNEYFTRVLKTGARPVQGVNDASVVVSPGDCIINMINSDITSDSQIPLKGRMTLNVGQLLGHSKYTDHFLGGTAMSCFLMPDSYHHYHSPVSGTLVESRENVGALYFGMDDMPAMFGQGNLGFNQDFSVFEQFRHGYFVIETQRHGYVAVIPVGLNTIGSVAFEDRFKDIDERTAIPLVKGERLGCFKYGGSLVVLIFERNRVDSIKIQQGQQIGILH